MENNIHHRVVSLHDDICGKTWSSLKPYRNITTFFENDMWVAVQFFEDPCHRIFLINKEYEIDTAVSSVDEEYEFDFGGNEVDFMGSACVTLTPELPFSEQLPKWSIIRHYSDKVYLVINVE